MNIIKILILFLFSLSSFLISLIITSLSLYVRWWYIKNYRHIRWHLIITDDTRLHVIDTLYRLTHYHHMVDTSLLCLSIQWLIFHHHLDDLTIDSVQESQLYRKLNLNWIIRILRWLKHQRYFYGCTLNIFFRESILNPLIFRLKVYESKLDPNPFHIGQSNCPLIEGR